MIQIKMLLRVLPVVYILYFQVCDATATSSFRAKQENSNLAFNLRTVDEDQPLDLESLIQNAQSNQPRTLPPELVTYLSKIQPNKHNDKNVVQMIYNLLYPYWGKWRPSRSVEDCPSSYEKVGRTCLSTSCTEDQYEWKDARKHCKEHKGGDLAVFSNVDDLESAIQFLKKKDPSRKCSYWIGGSDEKHEDNWRWHDGSPMPRGSPPWGRLGDNVEPSGGKVEGFAMLYHKDNYLIHDISSDLGRRLMGGTMPLCQVVPLLDLNNDSYDHNVEDRSIPLNELIDILPIEGKRPLHEINFPKFTKRDTSKIGTQNPKKTLKLDNREIFPIYSQRSSPLISARFEEFGDPFSLKTPFDDKFINFAGDSGNFNDVGFSPSNPISDGFSGNPIGSSNQQPPFGSNPIGSNPIGSNRKGNKNNGNNHSGNDHNGNSHGSNHNGNHHNGNNHNGDHNNGNHHNGNNHNGDNHNENCKSCSHFHSRPGHYSNHKGNSHHNHYNPTSSEFLHGNYGGSNHGNKHHHAIHDNGRPHSNYHFIPDLSKLCEAFEISVKDKNHDYHDDDGVGQLYHQVFHNRYDRYGVPYWGRNFGGPKYKYSEYHFCAALKKKGGYHSGSFNGGHSHHGNDHHIHSGNAHHPKGEYNHHSGGSYNHHSSSGPSHHSTHGYQNHHSASGHRYHSHKGHGHHSSAEHATAIHAHHSKAGYGHHTGGLNHGHHSHGGNRPGGSIYNNFHLHHMHHPHSYHDNVHKDIFNKLVKGPKGLYPGGVYESVYGHGAINPHGGGYPHKYGTPHRGHSHHSHSHHHDSNERFDHKNHGAAHHPYGFHTSFVAKILSKFTEFLEHEGHSHNHHHKNKSPFGYLSRKSTNGSSDLEDSIVSHDTTLAKDITQVQVNQAPPPQNVKVAQNSSPSNSDVEQIKDKINNSDDKLNPYILPVDKTYDYESGSYTGPSEHLQIKMINR